MSDHAETDSVLAAPTSRPDFAITFENHSEFTFLCSTSPPFFNDPNVEIISDKKSAIPPGESTTLSISLKVHSTPLAGGPNTFVLGYCDARYQDIWCQIKIVVPAKLDASATPHWKIRSHREVDWKSPNPGAFQIHLGHKWERYFRVIPQSSGDASVSYEYKWREMRMYMTNHEVLDTGCARRHILQRAKRTGTG